MKVVILCGGEGSRIRDVSELVPKPMLPIGGKPILWHIMKLYAHHGFTDFVLCLGYKGRSIREFFLNFRAMIDDCTVHVGRHGEINFHQQSPEDDWRVTLVDTGDRTATGGRVNRIRKYVENDPHFCLTYGDGVSDINLRELVRFHEQSGLAATVTGVHAASGRFGELDIHGDRARAFNEKPSISAGRISGGFFVMNNKKFWEYMPPGDDVVLERIPMASIAHAGELGVYRHDGYWQCMDTPREFALLNNTWDQKKAPWKVWNEP